MKKLILVVAMVGLVSGCASGPQMVTDVFGNNTDRHSAYLAAQLAAIQAEKPTFELEAHPGEEIRLTGVRALRVWGGSGATQEIRPYESPGYKLAHAALGYAPLAFGAYMFRTVVKAAPGIMEPHDRQVVDPYERSVVDPFTREAIDPFVIEPFVAPIAP